MTSTVESGKRLRKRGETLNFVGAMTFRQGHAAEHGPQLVGNVPQDLVPSSARGRVQGDFIRRLPLAPSHIRRPTALKDAFLQARPDKTLPLGLHGATVPILPLFSFVVTAGTVIAAPFHDGLQLLTWRLHRLPWEPGGANFRIGNHLPAVPFRQRPKRLTGLADNDHFRNPRQDFRRNRLVNPVAVEKIAPIGAENGLVLIKG